MSFSSANRCICAPSSINKCQVQCYLCSQNPSQFIVCRMIPALLPSLSVVPKYIIELFYWCPCYNYFSKFVMTIFYCTKAGNNPRPDSVQFSRPRRHTMWHKEGPRSATFVTEKFVSSSWHLTTHYSHSTSFEQSLLTFLSNRNRILSLIENATV